ncbi:MAG: sigma 54-interacting transcriptional regulator, partial [Calditrichaeota bacterium]|nr:sigma 54-interacting transcriptional regulator [Calditrichota bacterium]
ASGQPVVGQTAYIITAQGERIPISVSTALLRDAEGKVIGGAETFRDLSEVQALREELQGRARLGELFSQSPEMQKIFAVLPAIAASSCTVLITGETGTGKEQLARTIHALSPRGKGPFVAVNCGALPETLLESELFGYKAGAFTGATKDKPGRFALAKGGTLFLDEIGDMTPALQVRLLRVLQERTYEPLGAVRSEQADVRIIAATNKDLASLVREGRFREDLYYRINVVRLDLPPLRRRRQDIPLLIEQMIERLNRLQHKSIRGVSADALSLLVAYDWPGNIRELENAIEHAFILCQGELIEMAHLPPELTGTSHTFGPASKGPRPVSDVQRAKAIVEAQTIQRALERHGYNRVAAARELGIHKSTLFRKIKRLGLVLPERGGRSRR